MLLFQQKKTLAGDIRQEALLKKLKLPQTMFCLIVFGWFDCLFSHSYVPNRCRKQQDHLVRVVLLEALAQRFVALGENDVRPRGILTHRVGCPGRG